MNLNIIVVLLCNIFAIVFARYAQNYNHTVYGHHGTNSTYGYGNNINKGHHNSTYFYHNNTINRPYNNNTRIAFGPYNPIPSSG